MDKQNEGIQDPGVKVIPHDMGGYAAVRSWGKERPVTAKTRRRLVKHTPNIPLSIISGLGECHRLSNNLCDERKIEKKRVNKRKIKIIMGVNDLLTVNPELAKEWDSEKNGSLTPQDVKPKSNKKVWWICELHHSWQAAVSERFDGSGCPYCQAEFKTSFPEQAIFFYLSKFSHAENRVKLDKREIDIYLPQLKIGIEYDGLFFHNSSASEKRENSKNLALKKQGIRLLRIKESQKDNRTVGNVIYYVPNYNYSNLNQAIVKLFTMIDELANTNYSKEIQIDIDKDRIEIYKLYKQRLCHNKWLIFDEK